MLTAAPPDRVAPGVAPGPTPAGRAHTLDVLLLVCAGALLVSLAYARGRSGAAGGTALFWAGQALLLLPVALRVLAPAAGLTERLLVLTGGAAAQAVVVLCYSPDQFRFPDELQHLRSAQDLLQSGHLFTPNPYLSVSPGFPGLEEVATALTRLTGLSLFHAGVVTVSLAHVVLPLAVYLFASELARDDRVAAVAAVIYGTAPHNGFFNTLFVYGALALPFFALTLRAVLRTARQGRPWWALPPFAVLLCTHHLTALAALGIWAALLVALRLGGVPARRLWPLAGVLGAAAATAAGWTAWHAPSTFGYIAGPLADLVDLGGSTPTGARQPVVLTPPLWETATTMAAAVVTTLLVLLGLVLLHRRAAPRSVLLAAGLGLAYPAVLVVRVAAAGGQELAGRGLTYVVLLVAVPAAVGLLALRDVRWAPWWLLPGAATAVLLAATVTAGLPPSWERLPGRHLVAGFESGVDLAVSSLGPWAERSLPAGARVACDYSTCSMLGGYGRAELSTSASDVYYAETNSEADALIAALGLQYLVVDRRMTEQRPVTGVYFFRDTQEGRHTTALPQRLIAKFDHDPLLDRVYDNGAVRIYGTARTWGG